MEKTSPSIVENAIANCLKILEIVIDGAIDILKVQVFSTAEE